MSEEVEKTETPEEIEHRANHTKLVVHKTAPRPVLNEMEKEKSVSARVNLYSEHPFFAQIAQYLIPHASHLVPTAGVTAGSKMFINPAFSEACNVQDMTFIIAHEAMHCVLESWARMPEGANHEKWNQATDIAINYLLANTEKGAGMALPREEVIKPLFGGEFTKYDGWIAEDIYYDLMKNHQEQCPFCGKGQQGDEEDEGEGGGDPGEQQAGQNTSGPGNSCGCFKGYWWDGSGSALGNPLDDESMSDQEKAEWKDRIASAAEYARQRGQLPGALDKFCTTILNPRKNWRRELRLAANRALRKRCDWKRVSRRTAGRIRTPGRSPHMPEAVVYIDTSGSMSDDDIMAAINEVAEIIRLGGGKGTLILGDWDVYYCGEVSVKSLSNLPVKRGGTNFVPVFEKIKEEKLKPAIFIGFSDLEGGFPDYAPNFPVIWCRPEGWKSEAPWGKVIDIEL